MPPSAMRRAASWARLRRRSWVRVCACCWACCRAWRMTTSAAGTATASVFAAARLGLTGGNAITAAVNQESQGGRERKGLAQKSRSGPKPASHAPRNRSGSEDVEGLFGWRAVLRTVVDVGLHAVEVFGLDPFEHATVAFRQQGA